MMFLKRFFACGILLICFSGCQKSRKTSTVAEVGNSVVYAKGLQIYQEEGFTKVRVTSPWPNAKNAYTYILRKKNASVPDSLAKYPVINVPIRTVVVTSTTHIPSLEMLGMENSLVAFPNTSYVSSEKIRARIDKGHVRELGSNQNMNTEVVIDLAPDLIVGYGIDENNAALDNLKKSGLSVILNGDWNEESPLGKAEWIKFFGALYDIPGKAHDIFSAIEADYKSTLSLVENISTRPTVLAGAMYDNRWYLPHGESWGAAFIGQAGGQYLWSESKGTGSLSLPFEAVLQKGRDADYWIGPGQFTSLEEMGSSNPHYKLFKAFRNANVYSFSSRKGATGGVIYYELAPNRPDLVLKDLVSIMHPGLLPNHKPFFFEKLK